MMQLGAEGVFVGSGIFKSGRPRRTRPRPSSAPCTNFDDPEYIAHVSENLGEAMVGINKDEIELLMAERGIVDGNSGVLAVQGAFAEHAAVLDELGEPWFELRCLRNDLESPRSTGSSCPEANPRCREGCCCEEGMLYDDHARSSKMECPCSATCAGLILLAERESSKARRWRQRTRASRGPNSHLETHVTSRSSETPTAANSRASIRAAKFAGLGEVPTSFIRAPRIVDVCDGGVEPLAHVDGTVVAVREGAQIACAFHPELDGDTRIHELFLGL